MSILDLQKRMRQLGEIRIGHVVEAKTKSGKTTTRPEKLSKFRFTSPSADILTAVAKAYGGDVQPWTPANGGLDEFEVYTTTDRIPVVIPPLAVTQWYELYAGSKCVRRCDGQAEQKSDSACLCDPEQRDCSITTRLNVMMRDVPPIGYWLLTSRGYYAAVELPPIADLLAQGGGNVPGWLGLEERRAVVEKPSGESETRRFMVPTLDIDLSPAQILSGQAGTALQVEAQPDPRAAIESGGGQPDWLAELKAVSTLVEWRALWNEAAVAPEWTPQLREQFVAAGERLKESSGAGVGEDQQSPPAAGVPAPGQAAEQDPDAVWQAVLAEAGRLEMTIKQVEADFASSNQGVTPETASAGELAVYLEQMKERDA